MTKHNYTRQNVCARPVKPMRLPVAAVMIVLGAVYLSAVLAGQSDEVVEGARPVAKAMSVLSRELGWTITYEDPPYTNAEDLRDLSDTPVESKRVIVPSGGRVTLPSSVTLDKSVLDPTALLESVLETEDTARGRVKRFRVLRSASVLHVVPMKILDSAGEWRSVSPVLNTRIVLKHEEIDGLQFLDMLCAETTRVSGENVRVGRVSYRVLQSTKLPARERKGVARTLLLDLLTSTGARLTWFLLYDPITSTYLLHIGPPGAIM